MSAPTYSLAGIGHFNRTWTTGTNKIPGTIEDYRPNISMQPNQLAEDWIGPFSRHDALQCFWQTRKYRIHGEATVVYVATGLVGSPTKTVTADFDLSTFLGGNQFAQNEIEGDPPNGNLFSYPPFDRDLSDDINSETTRLYARHVTHEEGTTLVCYFRVTIQRDVLHIRGEDAPGYYFKGTIRTNVRYQPDINGLFLDPNPPSPQTPVIKFGFFDSPLAEPDLTYPPKQIIHSTISKLDLTISQAEAFTPLNGAFRFPESGHIDNPPS